MKFKQIGSNRTEVETKEGVYVLISYETPVAAFIPGEGVWREDTSSSRTTAKHINQWIRDQCPNATQTPKPREEIAELI